MLAVAMLLLCTQTLAQGKGPLSITDNDDEKRLEHYISTGLEVGGQIDTRDFVYKSGFNVQYSVEKAISNRLSYGLGTGYTQWQEESFVPVFALFRGLLSKKTGATFISARLGYAFGWNNNIDYFLGYDYRGGLMFSPGVGKKFVIDDKYAIMFSMNYKHQFATIEYNTLDNNSYEEQLNYDLLVFKLSFGIIKPLGEKDDD